MEPLTLALIAGTVYAVQKWRENQAVKSQPKPLVVPAPQKIITLVGAAGAGKSSTANALLQRPVFSVGVEHGTTQTLLKHPYINGYELQDTPGSLDLLFDATLIESALQSSEVIIYVAKGQLYRQEIDYIQTIVHNQQRWDASLGTNKLRYIWLYINAVDLKYRTMTHHERSREESLIKAQVQEWIKPDNVVFGSAAPFFNDQLQKPDIAALETLIMLHIQ